MYVCLLATGVQGKSELSCKALKLITFCKHIRDGHKSNCSSEQLLQQKFKFMVKNLCINKVASCFPFLRSCMYSMLYFFTLSLYSSARHLVSCNAIQITYANLYCIYLLYITLVYVGSQKPLQDMAILYRAL